MSYHQLFDHLGKPIRSAAQRQQAALTAHRIVRGASWLVIIGSLCILAWGR